MSTFVHPQAIVNPKAELADGVTVGPFTVIEEGVTIGEGTWIAASVSIDRGARIGKECKIYQGAILATPPQDLKYRNEPTVLEIGDRTTVREYCTLHRATPATGVTRIGNDCLIMAYSHVAHDCHIGNNVVIANTVQMGGHTVIEDYAIIGGMSPIHQFVRIGCHSMMGGGWGAGKDVPPYVLAMGRPLSFEKLNTIGLRRRGFSPETIASIENAYRILYKSGFNVSDGVRHIEEEIKGVPEVDHIVEFVRSSSRGIIPWRRRVEGAPEI
ncbi:MAG: acyl-[acyl-carrier-protein]--UDP-N-acetylglucosamine O-acyltransferase [Ignavibacteriales bacterium CG07_land_8_20_14_0_80_59_12]|nr:MAG: acyl-[acyl-carrier-protein]--UDP-N-acetylglucosamine O-acyltransferase [Ignavibacteriales bacterium CG07_land_8_20_14_0_80_59_12]